MLGHTMAFLSFILVLKIPKILKNMIVRLRVAIGGARGDMRARNCDLQQNFARGKGGESRALVIDSLLRHRNLRGLMLVPRLLRIQDELSLYCGALSNESYL